MDGLGPRIKQLRLQAGMSKAALARRVGVSDVTISYWESGTIKQIGHERLVALTSALCCSIKQLLDDDSLNAMAAASRTSGGTVLSLQAHLAAPWEQREDEPGEMSTLQMLTQDCRLVTPAENESFDFLSSSSFPTSDLCLIWHFPRSAVKGLTSECIDANTCRVSFTLRPMSLAR